MHFIPYHALIILLLGYLSSINYGHFVTLDNSTFGTENYLEHLFMSSVLIACLQDIDFHLSSPNNELCKHHDFKMSVSIPQPDSMFL